MEINSRIINEIEILDVAGEVDLYSSPQLRQWLLKAMGRPGPRLIVHLAQVSYIDSSGIATLVEGWQMAKKNRGKLKLAALGPDTLEVFRFARLDTVFNIYATVEEALADF
ncbi:MAG: STAS domain-containing protein [Deltaproteobacteria bacterium]|nr:STAS domain-containing protein [Deltaproteobacteria bacterium]